MCSLTTLTSPTGPIGGCESPYATATSRWPPAQRSPSPTPTPLSPAPIQNVVALADPAVQAICGRSWLQLPAPLPLADLQSASDGNDLSKEAAAAAASSVAQIDKGKLILMDASVPITAETEDCFVLATYNILSDVAVNNSIEHYLRTPPHLR